MSREHEHGKLLAEPIILEDGRVLSATGAPDDRVHIHIGEFGTSFPRFVIESEGNGDLSVGLVKTAQRLKKTLREIKII